MKRDCLKMPIFASLGLVLEGRRTKSFAISDRDKPIKVRGREATGLKPAALRVQTIFHWRQRQLSQRECAFVESFIKGSQQSDVTLAPYP